ncbi:putative 2-succinylbenzoate--CoA ligase [Andreprevotia sp. IGB-42]|uniref:AMP-binding protein n=1 Tax=Andreprevotia sp. IGB-42 TaxID=2497473 RepID=UPI0013580158|nr:AMP-binding protein [Andreprevotia sp. IGB-42]KAF0813782.1 putative 2-succinylbenzoate--CoA ligase [Andreprevotia sp. IGB-42]
MPDCWPIAAHAIIAWRGDIPIERHAFDADTEQAYRALAALAQPRIVLFETDSYRFAVWLIAAWRAGLTVVVPGDMLPATQAALPLPWVGVVADAALADWHALAAPSISSVYHAPGLEVFTSGSTGAPCAIHKTLTQLANETAALEAAFGSQIASDARIVSSVPHQHLYGLLFRILWPLAAGRAFATDTLPWPESIWALPAGARYALAASPAMLKRIPELPARAAPQVRFDAIFSSGGPLPADANLACSTRLGMPITEVYGSSETGGIAHRHHPQHAWTAQPGVELKTDDAGTLWLRSPFLATPDWFATSDRAALDQGQLTLLGRADRIVKVEEKRISLTRVETLLGALPEISAARALLLPNRRDEIGAVLVLSDAGRTLLAEKGKNGLDRQFRQALSGALERIALPRRWRFVAELPHNDMGKTTEAMLAALFAPAPANPEIVATRQDAHTRMLTLYIGAELIHFDGHFDAAPVLPGVVQVDWAIRLGKAAFGLAGTFADMRQLKFQRIIQPGALITLTMTWDAGKQQLAFAYASASGAHSSGRITFTGTQP